MAQAANFLVSYTSADRAWAEWIAWQLEAEGYQVVIQAWDFRLGRDFVQQMHQVVEEAQRTVAVLSPAYLDSAFGGVEWRAVFAKDPTGEHGSLLPVRVEEVEPPGLLKTRIHVDLVDRDATSARAALLAASTTARAAGPWPTSTWLTQAELWWDPKQPDQMDLWDSTVVLGERFFEEIVRRPVPIDTGASRR